MSNWDHEVDFLVVGSGSGGMTAAVTASDCGGSTLIIEKAEVYGGNSALSGGVAWIPNNHHMPKYGISDSPEDALTYLKQCTEGTVREERLKQYIKKAPEMVKYLEDHASVEFEAAEKYMDYYPELEGGKPGARSIDPAAFSMKKLGKDAELQRMGGMGKSLNMSAKDAGAMLNFGLATFGLLAKRLFAYLVLGFFDRIQGKYDDRMTLGRGLIGALRYSMQQRNIDLWLNTAFKEFVVEDGRVVGIVAEKEGKEVRIGGRKGVLVAAGGFEKNLKMREKYQPKPASIDWTAGSETNTGDAINAGLEQLNAAIEFMPCAWWTPTSMAPEGAKSREGGHIDIMVVDKGMPHSMFVDNTGRRFVNESAPYEDVVKGQYKSAAEGKGGAPCWIVFDRQYRTSSLAGHILPGPDFLLNEADLAWMHKSDTLEELAGKIGVDAEGLKIEVERFNGFAETGVDEDFARGDSLHDRYYAGKTKPNPCLGNIVKPPFYAHAVQAGDLGTKGGLKANDFGQVENESGDIIPGLYATGNTSGAVMGNSYPGAGSTIGPSMTYGYVSACHAMGVEKPSGLKAQD